MPTRPAKPSATRKKQPDLVLFGLRIREVRLSRKLTQAVVAERLGIGEPANYARIEQGRQNLSVRMLLRVARVLGVEASALLQAPRARIVRPGRPPKKR